jgi:hypothetical protein
MGIEITSEKEKKYMSAEDAFRMANNYLNVLIEKELNNLFTKIEQRASVGFFDVQWVHGVNSKYHSHSFVNELIMTEVKKLGYKCTENYDTYSSKSTLKISWAS